MISRKIIIGVMLTLATIGLTACQNSNSTSSSSAKTSQVKKPKKAKLNVNKLTVQQDASAITTYASHTYAGRWEKTLSSAKNKGLVISFHNRNAFSFVDKGKGYVYQAAPKRKASKTYYTIKGANAKQRVYFYEGKSYLGTQSIKEIVNELNEKNEVHAVNKLAHNTKIDREAIDTSADNTSK